MRTRLLLSLFLTSSYSACHHRDETAEADAGARGGHVARDAGGVDGPGGSWLVGP